MANRSTRLVLTAFVWRQALALAGFGIFFALALAVAALATWNVADPSFSYATDNAPTNILGFPGAAFADLMMQFLGLASLVALLPVLAFALALIAGRKYDRVPARLAAWGGGTLLALRDIGLLSRTAHLADPERHRRRHRRHDPALPGVVRRRLSDGYRGYGARLPVHHPPAHG
jgi:hypothetical protein